MGDKAGVVGEGGPGSSAGGGGEKLRGVRMRKWGKWVAEVRLPNSRQRIWLGSYDTQEKAARAYDAAQFCLRGPAASFNFPSNPPVIPLGRSFTPAQIQVAASQFAHANDEIDHQHYSQETSSAMQGDHPDGAAGVPNNDDNAQNNDTDKSSNLVPNLADSFENPSDPYNQCLGAFGGCPLDIAGGSFYFGGQTVHEELEDSIDESGAFYQPWGPLWSF